jgi:hypothetical protein
MLVKTGQKPKEPWHAVGIVASPGACAQALALRGLRFLAGKAAPVLPLNECPHPGNCKCLYKHYADRRAGPRRAQEKGAPPNNTPRTEQRKKRGRRADDETD